MKARASLARQAPLAHKALVESQPARERSAAALDRNKWAALAHYQTATAQQPAALEQLGEQQPVRSVAAQPQPLPAAQAVVQILVGQQRSAAADSAKSRVAHPSDQSAARATKRSRQKSARTPRLRRKKRALVSSSTSALAVHACRARWHREPARKCPRGTLGWEAEKMIARPGQRARSAQSTSLLKPTAQIAACCPNATWIGDFPQQTLSVIPAIVIFRSKRPD
jgi:hypothetical protein